MNIYPLKLQEYVRATKYIPRKIRKNEHLKMYHRYWFVGLEQIVAKVDDLYLVNTREYYTLKCERDLYACISHPIRSDCYELLHNKEGIEKLDIINSNISYTGAEIKYWFVYHKIDFNKDKYCGFWSFLNPVSDNVLVDNKYYFVSYNEDRKQKFQMILDKGKL